MREMRETPRKTKFIAGAGLGALVLCGLGAGVLFAQADEADSNVGITPAQATAAMQAAVAAQPGLIEELDVEREGNQTVCEVSVLAANGKDYDVVVNVNTNKVLRVER